MHRLRATGLAALVGIVALAVAGPAVPVAADAWRGLPGWGATSASPDPAGSEPTVGVRPRGDVVRVLARPRRGADVVTLLDATTPFDQRLVFPAIRVRDDPVTGRWYRILLPIRPNGTTGWIHERRVREVSLRERIVVDLSDRTLRRFRDGVLRHRFDVGIGLDQWPTPTGEFFVWATVPYPDGGPYGVHALGLSALSDAITDWPGGGRVAIHGTADPSNRGRQVSHGCIRVYNPQMLRLADVPMGTPVTVKA